MQITRLRLSALLAVVQMVAATAYADIDLRVESWPIAAPIVAFVRVSEGDEGVAGLARGDFAVTLDGRPLPRFGFRLPVDQDPAQNLSIVFVLADGKDIESAIPALAELPVGTFAAIVRAKYLPGDQMPWLRVHEFTRIDGDAGSRSLAGFLKLSIYDLASLRYGSRVPHLDWLSAGVDQLETPTVVLPRGPKAIILVGNGRHIDSWSGLTQSDIVARANAIGVPVFSIGTEDFREMPGVGAAMSAIASDTGGRYLRGLTTKSIGRAYDSVQSLLGSAYRLVIPSIRVTDCNPHMLEVTVGGETASASFVRCDTTPDPLEFRARERVAPAQFVVSNAATITGIDSPADISIHGGSYSLGCTSSFKRAPGTALPGDLVCVRHVASGRRGALTETTLVVGGVASNFYSTTRGVEP